MAEGALSAQDFEEAAANANEEDLLDLGGYGDVGAARDGLDEEQ